MSCGISHLELSRMNCGVAYQQPLREEFGRDVGRELIWTISDSEKFPSYSPQVCTPCVVGDAIVKSKIESDKPRRADDKSWETLNRK